MNADYGIDAPKVIRNLVIAGAGALALAMGAWTGILPPVFVLRPAPNLELSFSLLGSGLPAALGFLGGAGWMYFGSRYGKAKGRERLLDRVAWRGDERVLDVGCGRGLVLVGAARRLERGSAVGIDIWRGEDLSGNQPAIPLTNAEVEGVRERVSVSTADMRRLPFKDASFDVVTSRAAIHNLYSPPDRAAAIQEIARVLKPGGRAVIADIRHLAEYRREFEANGCPGVRLVDSRVASLLCAIVTFGSLRPNTLVARKAT